MLTYSQVAYWSSLTTEDRKKIKEDRELKEWKQKIRSMTFSKTESFSVDDYKNKLKDTL
ncbi:hypothetical protein AHIS2_p093 [Acaryochloris phage A-HIS2]|nr:hypothetical protein AHIS2_p093 [Acaryochloris phage A-HIS2]